MSRKWQTESSGMCSGARVKLAVYFFQAFFVDVCIYLRSGHTGMTEQFLDIAQIHAIAEKNGCK
jgi:hypothetical protein